MRLRQTLIVALVVSIVACQSNTKNPEKETASETSEHSFAFPDSLSARRISFVLKLREIIADKYWSDFGTKRTEGTFIYFNGASSEIFFPKEKVLSKLEDYKTFSEDYVLSARTDTLSYHFELMVSFDSLDADKFYFDNPVQQFLSVEETNEYIPSISSTEMWSNLVIHEMFHHFQYNNPSFREYAKSDIGRIPYDVRNLRKLCEEDADFRAWVQKENDLLMHAVEAENDSSVVKHIEAFLNQRAGRIEAYSEQHPFLDQVESYYVLQEGSARYVEYKCIQVLNEYAANPDSLAVLEDPRYNSLKEFADVDLTADDFSWLTYAAPETYHYALGFNQMRLLDKLGVAYKENLLDTPQKALHAYLEEYLKEHESRP